jgi:hypothetical protein
VIDGSLVRPIGDRRASEISWSSRAEAFYVGNTDGTSALYRSDDGERLTPADRLRFLPWSLAMLRNERGRFEIWAVDEPKRLVDLGTSVTHNRLSPDGRFLLTWFRDAQPTVIDLTWLRAGLRVTAEPSQALVDWACTPFAGRAPIDLDALARYTSNPGISVACQSTRR